LLWSLSLHFMHTCFGKKPSKKSLVSIRNMHKWWQRAIRSVHKSWQRGIRSVHTWWRYCPIPPQSR
jgi:hypothetical protein